MNLSKSLLLLIFVTFFTACNMGLEDAPFSGDYQFDDISVTALSQSEGGELTTAKISAEGSGKHKYLGEVTVNLEQEVNMETFKMTQRITLIDSDKNTIQFLGSGNLLPKGEEGEFIFVSTDSLIEGEGKYAKASGKSTCQGEILLGQKKVSCVQKGIMSYQ